MSEKQKGVLWVIGGAALYWLIWWGISHALWVFDTLRPPVTADEVFCYKEEMQSFYGWGLLVTAIIVAVAIWGVLTDKV